MAKKEEYALIFKQIVFGARLVNDIYDAFTNYTGTENMSLAELKQESVKKQNPLQMVVKSLFDVFIEIMAAILAAALLMGLTGVLNGLEIVKNIPSLYALNRLANLA